jgi:hypothetical protein
MKVMLLPLSLYKKKSANPFDGVYRQRLVSLLLSISILLLLNSCAQGPETSPSTAPGGGGETPQARQFISFTLRLNDAGRLSSGGYYIILFNAEVGAIDVTNAGTFTDGIRLSIDPALGPSHYWFHKIPAVPGPGYDMVLVTRVDEFATISPDQRSVTYTFNTTDSSIIFNQYLTNRFTAHALTTDNYAASVIGRVIDTMGPGPDISQNPEYTIVVSKDLGPEKPYPPNYPMDPLLDWCIRDDLGVGFPYVNFDIESFQINLL